MARYVIGGVVIVVFVVWGAYAFLRTTVQYVSIEQARSARTTVQVMGKIDSERVVYNVEKSRLEFAIYDVEAPDEAAAERLPVVYYGVVPGNFDQAASVVLKGKSDGSLFVAKQILVKCPSKYQGDGDPDYQDIRKHGETSEPGGA